MPVYIIEHLEPRVWRWCMIEYRHVSKIVGKRNLWFTNIKKCRNLARYGKVIKKSVSQLNLKGACVLDPEARKTLTPAEAKHIKYFIFGGILGDNPPQKRTAKELTNFIKKAVVRNIGKKQFSTDNAVYVVSRISKGVPLSKLKFTDDIEIKINSSESVILPFHYAVINNKPLISKELVTYLKRKKGF